MIVFRVACDGLSRERWDYEVGGGRTGVGICFTYYAIERRRQRKGRFSRARPEDRWLSSDERRYTSGLPRPTTIPEDVIEEAWATFRRNNFIGWYSEEARIK